VFVVAACGTLPRILEAAILARRRCFRLQPSKALLLPGGDCLRVMVAPAWNQ
jgi:hypothetical protein